MCVQVMRLTIRHSGDPPIRRGLQNLILDALTAFAYQNDGLGSSEGIPESYIIFV